MERLYFTFGTDPQFPYGIHDYVLVLGKDRQDCINAFKKKHPNRPGFDSINCADYYSPKLWEEQSEKYYKGKEPIEIIISDAVYGGRPEGFDPLWIFVPSKGELLYLQEGTGDNITPDDVEEGNIDYLDYTAFSLEDGEVDETDGGELLLPYMVQEHYTCLTDAVPDILEFAYDNMFLEARILERKENGQ